MQDGSAPGWREIMEQRHAALIEEVGGRVEAQVASEVARAVSAEKSRCEQQTAQAVAAAKAESTRVLNDAKAESARALAEAKAESTRVLNDAKAEAMRVLDDAQEKALRVLNEEKERTAEESRRRLSESLNQTLRRIRQTSAEHETLQLILEESAFCAARAVVVLVESGRIARVAIWRDAALRGDEEDSAPIDLKEAAALASCVETGDPMAALASPGEISSVLAAAFGGKSGGDKVYLFPVRVRQSTVALIVAGGAVTPAPLELLCEAAGMKLESLEGATRAPAAAAPAVAETGGLVQIAGVRNGTSAGAWEALSAEEQSLHLRAQRTARVRVAQIRISEASALRKGVQDRDIYQALRPSIDAARGEFRQNYMTQTPGMVDYLHLEIVRSLAHDNEKLLGADYPGPMA
jgi:cell division septum initiation protein DivIVA